MRLEQLRYLKDINQTKSISKTASHFFVSPQSVSKSMQQLEIELCATLLERTSTGVSLTKAGELVLKKLQKFPMVYDELREEFRNQNTACIDDKPLRSIRINTSSALATLLLPEVLQHFGKRYPKTLVNINEVRYSEILTSLLSGDCDMAFLSINDEYFFDHWNHVANEDVRYNLLLTDTLVACVSTSSPLAKREIITEKDLMPPNRTYLNIVFPRRVRERMTSYGFDDVNYALYKDSDIECHRQLIKELGSIGLMPRYVYQKAFAGKQFIAKNVEGAEQKICHVALYASKAPHPQLLEFTNILSATI